MYTTKNLQHWGCIVVFMYTLLQPAQEPLDKQWLELLQPLAAVPSEIYTYLTPSAASLRDAKETFYASDKTHNPALAPDEQFRESIVEHAEALRTLRTRISAEEKHETIRPLYEARIDELIANCQLWLAAADKDQAAYKAANKLLYGEPDRDIHAASCAWLRGIAEAYRTHEDATIAAAAEDVLRLVPDSGADPLTLQPSEEAFRDLLDLHNEPGGYTDQLFGSVTATPGSVITAKEGDVILERILAQVAPDYTIAENDGYWGVQHSHKHVVRPRDYALSPATFSGIVAHEVGSHLVERVNGLRSPLQLLGLGLDHYEYGNEGRALMREQLAAGSVQAAMGKHAWIFNILKHLGVSLGVGVSGNPRTFAEVYEAVASAYAFWALVTEQETSTVPDAAWDLTVRLLKGTDGRGGAYYKDIVYLEGNVRAWKLAEQFPERILQGDRGKYDIANPVHRARLQALGIIN